MAKKLSDPIEQTAKDALAKAYEERSTEQPVSPVDPTAQPQATSQADVNNQDARTRLWQSLDNTYGQQIKQSNENYDKAIAQQDQAFMNRGMQRSSYAGQTLANMQQRKMEAQNQITANQIADYQNRLNALDQQEQENQRWERQFAYQQERDTKADEQWQQQFQAQQDQWKQQFDYTKMSAQQQIAFNALMNMMEKGDKPSDKLLQQAGISRKDYEQMKTKAKKTSTGGSGGRGGNGGGANDPNDPWASLQNGLNSPYADVGYGAQTGDGNVGKADEYDRTTTGGLKRVKVKGV